MLKRRRAGVDAKTVMTLRRLCFGTGAFWEVTKNTLLYVLIIPEQTGQRVLLDSVFVGCC